MSEERDDVVILVDDEGKEMEFEHLDTVEMNDKEYVVLLPVEQEEGETDEVVILKIEHGDNGEDSFITVEDEKELDEVFEEFKAHMEEEYDEDEELDDEELGSVLTAFVFLCMIF
jgi:uncharacterized protein YrzB (UPF0473 family)